MRTTSRLSSTLSARSSDSETPAGSAFTLQNTVVMKAQSGITTMREYCMWRKRMPEGSSGTRSKLEISFLVRSLSALPRGPSKYGAPRVARPPPRPGLCILLDVAASSSAQPAARPLLLDTLRLEPARRPHRPAQACAPAHLASATARHHRVDTHAVPQPCRAGLWRGVRACGAGQRPREACGHCTRPSLGHAAVTAHR